MTPAVEILCREIWQTRAENPRALNPSDVSRRMYAAITVDLVRHGGYDPETDKRIAWLREIMRALREHSRRIEAHPDLEHCMRYLLGLDEESLAMTARMLGEKIAS
jgi:hypothetical protein